MNKVTAVVPKLFQNQSWDSKVIVEPNALESVLSRDILISSENYWDKLYNTLGVKSLKFVTKLFEFDKVFAKDYLFKLDLGQLCILEDDNSNFIALSNKISYDNYENLVNYFSKIPSDDIYQFQKDNLVSNDTIMIVYKDEVRLLNLSLLYECLDYFKGVVKDDKLYLIHEYYGNLYNSDILDIVINLVKEPIVKFDILNLYDNIENIKLSVSEVLIIFKSLNIIKGGKKLKIVNNTLFFKYFTELEFNQIYDMSSVERDMTLTSITVGDVQKLLLICIKDEPDINIHDIYWVLKKFLNKELLKYDIETVTEKIRQEDGELSL